MDKKVRIRKNSFVVTSVIASLALTVSCKNNQKQEKHLQQVQAQTENSLAFTNEIALPKSIWPGAAQQALEIFNQNKTDFAVALISQGNPVGSGQKLVILKTDTCEVYKVEADVQTFPAGTQRFLKTDTFNKEHASYKTCSDLKTRPPLKSKQSKFLGGIQYELHFFDNTNKEKAHQIYGPFYIASLKNLDAEAQALVDYMTKISKL